MAFFRRLFGGRSGDTYSRGIALFEEGRSAEAVELLRDVYRKDMASPQGSVAGLYLRQALVAEGRRLLAAGDAAGAAAVLAEAVEFWPDFPDLQFITGAARGLAGQWDGALAASRRALRRNGDYCEARLLEVCALVGLQRGPESVEAAGALLESGRRVDHHLLDTLDASPGDLAARPDLTDILRRTVVGDDIKQQLTEAVSLCRAGRWQQGLELFARLCTDRPDYPDIRAKHAAALYQRGDLPAALAEVEAALALNARYRTAVSLKGLIMAEAGDPEGARTYLAEAVPRVDGAPGRHEELFVAYLRAVLELLAGDLDQCRSLLAPWPDLAHQFARAAVLLAACDHLQGKPDAALHRLADVGDIWSSDGEIRFLRGALLLELQQWHALDDLLLHWPQAADDPRPLLLRARLDVARGRPPVLPDEPPATPDDGLYVHPAAWRQLEAAASLAAGDVAAAWDLLLAQFESGQADEETGRLMLRAAPGAGQRPPANLAGRIGAPDSWGPDLCRDLRRRGEGLAAEQFVDARRKVRPDQLRWSWLAAGFWLDPVRRWLA